MKIKDVFMMMVIFSSYVMWFVFKSMDDEDSFVFSYTFIVIYTIVIAYFLSIYIVVLM